MEEIGECAKLLGGVLHAKFLSVFPSWGFDQRFMAVLRHIDGYPDNCFQRTLRVGHGRSVSFGEC